MAEAKKPKWDPGQDYRAGLKAYELAQEFKTEIEPRLPAGLLEGLKEDVSTLGSIAGEGKTKVVEIKGFTGSQNQAISGAGEWAASVREALKRGKAPKDVQKAAGVGSKFHSTVDSAAASANSVLLAYEKYTGAFRDAGVLPDDIAEGKVLVAAISSAEMTQETAIAKKTASTTGRKSLRIRVEDAVDRIRGAGIMQFRKNKPETAARFEALVPVRGGGGDDAPPAEPPKV
jgi:hypothetical protein